jgi:hypothetical protein
MTYRSRTKYTPGGGPVVLLGQVSRFVSFSVLGWCLLSLFLILFVSEGKITDSFDLKLLKGLFTNFDLFGTALILLGLNGVLGAILSIPAIICLFLSRTFVEYHLSRYSLRGRILKLKLVKIIPLFILLLSHFIGLIFNLISAPQVISSWFRDDGQIASTVSATHFAMTDLIASFYDRSGLKPSVPVQKKIINSHINKKIHLFLLPADVLEDEDFKQELLKKKKDIKPVLFLMTGSNILEELTTLLSAGSGPTTEFLKSQIHLPENYGQVLKSEGTSSLLLLSPHLQFGRNLYGHGVESLEELKEEILMNEAQRRLVLSQISIMGALRWLGRFSFPGYQFSWGKLVDDDVYKLKEARQLSELDVKNSSFISFIQLSSMEKKFSSIQVPFRSVGWPSRISKNERRRLFAEVISEIENLLAEQSEPSKGLWMIVPYADDRRTNPLSLAYVKEKSDYLIHSIDEREGKFFLSMNHLGKGIARYLGEVKQDNGKMSQASTPSITPSGVVMNALGKSPALINCFETEVDPHGVGFYFQGTEFRERALSVFLNNLFNIPESELKLLGQKSLNLLTRDPGFGIICKADSKDDEDLYLLRFNPKERRLYSAHDSSISSSSLMLKVGHSLESISSSIENKSGTFVSRNVSSKTATMTSIKNSILEEFDVFKIGPLTNSKSEGQTSLRMLGDEESKMFFLKFGAEANEVIESFLRTRIR